MSIYDFYRWYRDGTVSVTNGSPNVVGADTHWADGPSIRPGDLFSLDGDSFYEIESITDGTHLVLASNYAGATAATQSYSIIRNFAATPGADLVAQQITLVQRSLERERQFIDWQSLPASADPEDPTIVEFTRYDGGTTNVKSLAQIQDDIDRAIDAGSVGPPGPEGPAGPPGAGLVWQSDWSVTHGTYHVADGVYGAPNCYFCKLEHVAAASNQPGVGANWETYWDILVQNTPGVQGPKGDQGDQGDQGEQGTPGTVWFSGAVDPSGGTGVNGDYYLNTVSGDVFKKVAGAWALQGNIRGPQGAAGSSIVWLPNAWNTYENFSVNQALHNATAAWICIVAHARTADKEPGVGANYATYWSKLAQDGSNQGVPNGGTVNQIIVKQSSVDGDAAWETNLPANCAKLQEQDWTGTDLADLATRAYSSLTGRPADDNWLTTKASITKITLLEDTVNEIPYFMVGRYLPDTATWQYWKTDYTQSKLLFKQMVWDQVTADTAGLSMALQSSDNVNITGGQVFADFVHADHFIFSYLDWSPGLTWFTTAADGDTISISGSQNQRTVLLLTHSVDLDFTWPALLAGQSSTQSGRMIIRNDASGKAITLPAADLVIGVQPTAINAVYMLAWERVHRVVSTDPFVQDKMTVFSWIY